MPIKPELRGFYPIDWCELSRSIRFRRAKGACEACRRPHGKLVCVLNDGRWFDDAQGYWRDGRGKRVRTNLSVPMELPEGFGHRWTMVRLTCAHLNHDLADNAAAYLAALCQRCHPIHDRPHIWHDGASPTVCDAQSATCSKGYTDRTGRQVRCRQPLLAKIIGEVRVEPADAKSI